MSKIRDAIENNKTETATRTADDAADAALQAELDATQVGTGLNVDGSYTADAGSDYITGATSLKNADSLLDDAIKAEEVARIAADGALQTEVDTTQTGAGLNSDGTYAANGGANYISTSTSLVDADNDLDAQIKVNADALVQEITDRTNADAAIQTELNTTQTGAGLNADGTYTAYVETTYIPTAVSLRDADQHLDTAIDSVNTTLTSSINTEVTDRTNADAAIQTEVDAIETGAGLNTDGTYTADPATTYLTTATSLKDADEKLDTAINTEVQARISDVSGIYTELGEKAPKLQGEPNGFINRGDVTMSWDNVTRTLTLTGTYEIYCDGIKYQKTGDSIQISDTEGEHYIYYDNTGNITTSTTFVLDIIVSYTLISVVYWDATNNVAVPHPFCETHGVEMPAEVHLYLHTTEGCRYTGGMSLSLTADGDDALDSSCQFTSTQGSIRDEDIPHTILAKTVLTSNVQVLWREGVNGDWRMDNTRSFPVQNAPAGLAYYNEYTGTTWQLTESGNNSFVLAHIYAVPGVNHTDGDLIAIVGQNTYTKLSDAQTGAFTEAYEIDASGLPTAEFVLVATIITKTSNTYTNTTKTIFVSTETGFDYIDWRATIPTAIEAQSATSWGSLTGTLSDQTDLQAELDGKMNVPSYTIITTAQTLVSGDQLFCNTTTAPFTVTLPLTPSANDYVDISDYAGTFATNNLTIARNGSNIMGVSADWVLNTNNDSVRLIYVDATQGWRLV